MRREEWEEILARVFMRNIRNLHHGWSRPWDKETALNGYEGGDMTMLVDSFISIRGAFATSYIWNPN